MRVYGLGDSFMEGCEITTALPDTSRVFAALVAQQFGCRFDNYGRGGSALTVMLDDLDDLLPGLTARDIVLLTPGHYSRLFLRMDRHSRPYAEAGFGLASRLDPNRRYLSCSPFDGSTAEEKVDSWRANARLAGRSPTADELRAMQEHAREKTGEYERVGLHQPVRVITRAMHDHGYRRLSSALLGAVPDLLESVGCHWLVVETFDDFCRSHPSARVRARTVAPEGLSFVEWAGRRGFPIGPFGHPLAEAHAALADLMLRDHLSRVIT